MSNKDTIYRQDAIDAVVELCKHYTPTKSVKHPHIDFVIEELNNVLSAPPERKKGKWIDDGTELGCCCSECGVTLDDYFYGSLHEICLSKMPNYCPNCGSYNRGEE